MVLLLEVVAHRALAVDYMEYLQLAKYVDVLRGANITDVEFGAILRVNPDNIWHVIRHKCITLLGWVW